MREKKDAALLAMQVYHAMTSDQPEAPLYDTVLDFIAAIDGWSKAQPYHELEDLKLSELLPSLYYVADGGAEPAFEGDPGIEPRIYRRAKS